MEHVYLGCILEKVQPETRKKKKTKTTNKQERYQPLEEKKIKEMSSFHILLSSRCLSGKCVLNKLKSTRRQLVFPVVEHQRQKMHIHI